MTTPRPRATLLAQVLALVLLSLVVAQAINVWAVFHLPSPTPDYFTGAEIAQALERGPGAAPTEPRPLQVRRASSPPRVDADGRQRFTKLRSELAVLLGESPDDIVVRAAAGPFDRHSIRDIRNRLERAGQRETPFLLAPFEVAVRRGGDWLIASPPPARFPTPWQVRIMIWFVITAVAMTPVAWWFARRLSSSVALFAEAAERLGRDPNAPPLSVKGPSEIAPAVAAFNRMQDRLRTYVSDRTAMAAAMAHDLRTPLTRLRFRVEGAPAGLRAKMTADIEEMEAMIAASLAYVRDSSSGAEHRPLELSSLLESVFDDLAETGAVVSVDRADRVVLHGDPMGLRRLVTNLAENACKFGGGARGRVYTDDGTAVIEVEDDGPGVADSELDKVFEPFYRGEPSRSRETGGSGLGLAAVRSIARGHGGDVVLCNRRGGGLLAQVRLPI